MKNKFEIFFFDLDGTLAKSKTKMDKGMSGLISQLLENTKVIVISGASFSQFRDQFLKSLPEPKFVNLDNLYIAPLTAGSLYTFKKGIWTEMYASSLNKKEKEKILNALDESLMKTKFVGLKKPHGSIIQDRGGQITFSALGENAPLELKKKWDPDHKKRIRIKEYLDILLPEFKIGIGGTTSIDIRKKGIDKGSGIKKLSKLLSVPLKNVIFFGDAIYEGGNDFAATKIGIETRRVSSPEDTKKILKELINNQ